MTLRFLDDLLEILRIKSRKYFRVRYTMSPMSVTWVTSKGHLGKRRLMM